MSPVTELVIWVFSGPALLPVGEGRIPTLGLWGRRLSTCHLTLHRWDPQQHISHLYSQQGEEDTAHHAGPCGVAVIPGAGKDLTHHSGMSRNCAWSPWHRGPYCVRGACG